MPLASFFNLAGPDLIILALILLMLVGPLVVILVILRIVNRSRSTPPPLPKSDSTARPEASD